MRNVSKKPAVKMTKEPRRPIKPSPPQPDLPGRHVAEDLCSYSSSYYSTFKGLRESVEKFCQMHGVDIDAVVVEISSDLSGYGDDPESDLTFRISGTSPGRPDPDYQKKLADYELAMSMYEEDMKIFRKASKEYKQKQAQIELESLEKQKMVIEERLAKLKT